MGKLLREGLRTGDLNDLVLPLISVDEYQSKVDDNAIVFGFYVSDGDAADDLNRFIQKSPVTLLDTEISPAPDQHGYYLVFVEMMNDARLSDNVAELLEELSPLVNIDHWQMRMRHVQGLVDFSKEELSKHLDKNKKSQKVSEQAVMDFLSASDLQDAVIDGETLELRSTTIVETFNILGFGAMDAVSSDHRLTEQPIMLGSRDLSYARRLKILMGEGWYADELGGSWLLQRVGSPDALLLRSV